MRGAADRKALIKNLSIASVLKCVAELWDEQIRELISQYLNWNTLPNWHGLENIATAQEHNEAEISFWAISSGRAIDGKWVQ